MAGVLGIHHVTAIAGDPQRNVDFYAGVLGLRLVKRTVNYDDIRTYHFYYGDATGSPGSLLTFFAWPGGRRGRAGAGQAAAVGLAIPQGSIGFWIERLLTHGVRHEAPSARRLANQTERVIALRDPDGLMLELVGSDDAERRVVRETDTELPAAHAIRGLHAVTLWQNDGRAT
ncbi:MAG: VOC family protein, partial [Gemmatimonadales bacterium]